MVMMVDLEALQAGVPLKGVGRLILVVVLAAGDGLGIAKAPSGSIIQLLLLLL